MRHLLVSLLFTLMPLAGAAVTWADDSVGSITELKGDAHISRGSSVIVAAVAMPVFVNDKLETAPGGKLTVQLLGGSQILLTESSIVVIDKHVVAADKRSNSIIRLLLGRIRAIIGASIEGGVSNFEVHTPNAIAAARGTDFEVAYISGKPCPEAPSCLNYTTVGVYSGEVEVTNPTGPPTAPVSVKGGLQTTVPCQTPPTSPAPYGMEELGAPTYH